ncbi:hypothetical protein VNO77_01435 [Canavalia gladiata]|uniref:Protein TIFY n=1 Tax=Canavalia gladiata TaxID=3824 RepID=A0AAN9MR80_CANGL
MTLTKERCKLTISCRVLCTAPLALVDVVISLTSSRRPHVLQMLKSVEHNCNLELRLFPPSRSDLRPIMEAEVNESPQQVHHQQQQNHPLTIFYDGKICVSDVTEYQARSILMLANKEIEERMKTPNGSEPSSPLQSHNLHSPGTGLSMKRSLQRFLQKRKNRNQETSPYRH